MLKFKTWIHVGGVPTIYCQDLEYLEISTIYNHYAPLNDYAPLVTDMISAGRPKKFLRIFFAFSMDFY